jgi:tetratricopeptide (TPR) repeat protein
MRLGTTRWLLAEVLCLIFGLALATAQQTAWENYMEAGQKAYEQGDYSEARKMFSAALEEADKFGPDDPRVAISVAWVTVLNDTQILGPEHLAVTTSLNNLALLYHNQGKYAQAEPLYQRALAIREKALGPGHPDVADTLENYAGLLRKIGRHAEADKMEARAQAIRAKHAQEIPQR